MPKPSNRYRKIPITIIPSKVERRVDEIISAEKVLRDQVWYDRCFQNMRRNIRLGKETRPPREIWNGALEAAAKIEKEYGKENLGPWDDFEWGMINGKLSALRWVLGDEWDFLDT